MNFLNLASARSVQRGLDYYEQDMVREIREVGHDAYEGIVAGNGPEPYHVRINIVHPRKGSACDCPFAAGRKVVCKHQVALFFAAHPEAVRQYKQEVEEQELANEEEMRRYQEEQKRLRIERAQDVRKYVARLSAKEAREQLVEAILRVDDLQEELATSQRWW